MSDYLRIALISISLLTAIYCIKKIRKSQMQIDDSIFWIVFAAVLIIISVFPGIIINVADILNVQSPANLIFLMIIFVLTIKIFLMSVKISQTESRLREIIERMAISEKDKEDQKKEQ